MRNRTSLRHNPDFMSLWAAETVSQIGSQITLVALPLLAALSLDASPSQMGILTAAGTAPFLVLGLFAGVWVDRLRRRPILIAMDLGRAALLLVVPLAWVLDALTIELLYAVAFFVGVQTLFFEVAYVSFLPVVVRRDQLVEGNSKLQGSASFAQVTGPGLAGLLVGLITAPLVILLDALSYLASALFILRIRHDEPAPERHARPNIRREMAEGLRATFGDPLLRAMAASSGTVSLFGYVFLAVYVLYMTRDLGFSASQVGLVFSLGGVGAVLGAVAAEPLKRRLGVGPTIILARLAFGVFGLLVPLAVSLPALEVPLVLAAEFLQWLALLVAMINEVSLRQVIVPERLLGRVTSTLRFLVSGMIPVGALLGGLLGELIGLRATLVVGVFGMLVAALWVFLSPLRSLHDHPAIAIGAAEARESPVVTTEEVAGAEPVGGGQ